jgi:hypothetical protein
VQHLCDSLPYIEYYGMVEHRYPAFQVRDTLSSRIFSLCVPGHDRKVLIVASQSLPQIVLGTNE